MAGYTKNIAVIKGIKNGFSADGGALSGLVKAEKYGSFFRAEISFINFAPLAQGRYITAITDGENTVVCEGGYCECTSGIDTSCGFAAVVCFANGEVSPVAVAVCGDMAWAAPLAVREAEKQEKIRDLPEAGAAYEDEAIAEDNYYEFGKDTQSEGDVCQNDVKKEGRGVRENEDNFRLRQEPEGGKALAEAAAENGNNCAENGNNCAENGNNCAENGDNCAENGNNGSSRGGREKIAPRGESGNRTEDIPPQNGDAGEEAREIPLASDLGFYSRMRGEIEKLLATHPRERELEEAVEGSRWVRINYGGKRFYVFGVIAEGETPAYVCYGVPAMGSACPESLKGMAGFIPAGSGGYWVMYQDARTGASVRLSST